MRFTISIILTASFLPIIVGAQDRTSAGRDLSGAWRIGPPPTTWTVVLKRDKTKEARGFPVYCGLGTRDPKESDGKEVTQQLCASLLDVSQGKFFFVFGARDDAKDLRGHTVCEAPFKAQGTMEGSCGNPLFGGNAFTATRVPKPQ